MASTLKVDTIVHPTGTPNNLTLDNAGNVTIGNNLTVTGTTTQTGAASFTGQILTAAGTAGAPAVARSGDADNGIFFPATNTMAISTAGTEDMRFTPEGNVTMNSATFSPTTPGTAGNLAMTGTLAMGSSFLRNRIINGGMDIWQRGTPISVSTSTVTYSADRWGIYQATGTGTITRSTDTPTGFQYSMQVVGAGTDPLQRIESVNCQDLSGATITLSFYLKQTVGAGSGSMTVLLQNCTAADNWAGINTINTQTITPTSSWVRYSITYTGLPSGATNGIAINIFPTSSGSSSTFFLTGVQVEVGSVATPFERRQYGTELMLCQRYYSVVPITGYAVNSTVIGISSAQKVSMRSTPTANFTGTITRTTDGATRTVSSGLSVVANTDAIYYVSATFSAALNAGEWYNSSNGGNITLSAEL